MPASHRPPNGSAPAPVEELRAERMRCRRMLELAQLRARQSGAEPVAGLDELRQRYSALTDALIDRYAADLSLVDSLLADAYPPHVGATRDGTERGATR